MDYWVLIDASRDGGVIDAYPPGAPESDLFSTGTPLAPGWPADATVRFSRRFPQARALLDFQPNTLSVLIASPKVRAVLDGIGLSAAEYLPVSIRDHAGEVVGPNHAILNLLGSVSAIDMERSTYQRSHILPDQISRIDELVLDRSAIPADAVMFRCTTFPQLFLVRDDVREAFEREGVTGYRLFKADGWDGEDF